MKRCLALLLCAFALPAGAQVAAATAQGIVVAHDGRIDLFDAEGRQKWAAPGVERATAVTSDGERVAVLDAWSNRVRIARLDDGAGETLTTAETPVAAAFVRGNLFVLSRDASALERIARGGARSMTLVAADPALLRVRGEKLYVYSRRDGILQEISAGGGVLRRAAVGSFASDLEIDGNSAYLLFPRQARLVMVDLQRLEVVRSVAAGGVPVDLAVTGRGTALSAPRLAIADPAAKRVWRTEGAQSVGAAFGRGFLRGLLGLGLFRANSSEFPSGVDRVESRGGIAVAFDSATGTLYRLGASKPVALAQDLPPQAFAIAGGGVAIWEKGRLRLVN